MAERAANSAERAARTARKAATRAQAFALESRQSRAQNAKDTLTLARKQESAARDAYHESEREAGKRHGGDDA